MECLEMEDDSCQTSHFLMIIGSAQGLYNKALKLLSMFQKSKKKVLYVFLFCLPA
jgi:hypothetical protein